MWNKGKVKAFTLLEALVALLVLSGGVLVFQGLTKLLHAELDYQAHQKQEEWILFQQQLQVELDYLLLLLDCAFLELSWIIRLI